MASNPTFQVINYSGQTYFFLEEESNTPKTKKRPLADAQEFTAPSGNWVVIGSNASESDEPAQKRRRKDISEKNTEKHTTTSREPEYARQPDQHEESESDEPSDSVYDDQPEYAEERAQADHPVDPEQADHPEDPGEATTSDANVVPVVKPRPVPYLTVGGIHYYGTGSAAPGSTLGGLNYNPGPRKRVVRR